MTTIETTPVPTTTGAIHIIRAEAKRLPDTHTPSLSTDTRLSTLESIRDIKTTLNIITPKEIINFADIYGSD